MRPILALLSCLLLFPAAHAQEAAYTVTFVPADPAQGFHFPYYLRAPKQAQPGKQVLVVETNNSGFHDSLDGHAGLVAEMVEGQSLGPLVAGALDQPLLVPVFPRSMAEPNLYTHALDRDAILIADGPVARLDRQLLRMVDDARARLARDGMPVRERFVMVGFSASGTFANRFAFLHPERLAAVVSGGINAFPMLPVPALGQESLDFPLGTADISALTGAPFRKDAWAALPQFVFMGAADDNDALQFDDAYSDPEREQVFRLLAPGMKDRWLAAQSVYLEASPNVTFVSYGRVGHWTDQRVNADVVNFVKAAIAQDAP